MLFKDKKNRQIEIAFNSDPISVSAWHESSQIGSMEFDEQTDTKIKLTYIEVEEDYQHCGIGTEMVRVALTNLISFELAKPVSQSSPGDGDWVSNEAELFFKSCKEKKIIKLNHRTVSAKKRSVEMLTKCGLFLFSPTRALFEYLYKKDTSAEKVNHWTSSFFWFTVLGLSFCGLFIQENGFIQLHSTSDI